MPFGVSSGIPNVIIHAKFHIDRLRGFWAAGPPKVPFPILIGTTLTTVLYYRADCDEHLDEMTKTTRATVSNVTHFKIHPLFNRQQYQAVSWYVTTFALADECLRTVPQFFRLFRFISQLIIPEQRFLTIDSITDVQQELIRR